MKEPKIVLSTLGRHLANMKLNSKELIKYYDDHAQEFFQSTYMVNMNNLYKSFLKLLPKNARILDAGCGPGRDSYLS